MAAKTMFWYRTIILIYAISQKKKTKQNKKTKTKQKKQNKTKQNKTNKTKQNKTKTKTTGSIFFFFFFAPKEACPIVRQLEK